MKTIIIKAGQGQGKSSLAMQLANELSNNHWGIVTRYDLFSFRGTLTFDEVTARLKYVLTEKYKNITLDTIIFEDFTSKKDVELVECAVRKTNAGRRITSDCNIIFCVTDY